MKKVNQQILGILEDKQLLNSLQNITNSHGQNEYGDITLTEAHERFIEVSDLLCEEIESGRFDQVSYVRRNAILNNLQSIRQHVNAPTQVISNVESLQDNLTIAGVYYRRIGSKDVENEIKNLAKLKRSITDFKQNYSNTKKNLEFIDLKKKELQELLSLLESNMSQISDSKKSVDTNLQHSQSVLNDTQNVLSKVKEIQQQIEEKRLSVETFSENIDEYKASIDKIQKEAEEIIAKREVVLKLIEDSREALKLGSARGISAAFDAQYESASDKQNTRGWLFAASILLLLAVGFTAWTIGGWKIKYPDSINSIFARIVAVSISIAGAIFCAKQYVLQKNIKEDYAYKSVLSKSIVAFVEEIDRHDTYDNSGISDSKGVKLYLSKVLDEIHQDPLRPRQSSKTNIPSQKTLNWIKELTEILSNR